MNDQHVGQLVFLRVYSGTLEAGSGSLTRPRTRRSASGAAPDAREQEGRVEAVAAGDIAAAIGLKSPRPAIRCAMPTGRSCWSR
jgi:elongation factor G